jgi:hypothetical protein
VVVGGVTLALGLEPPENGHGYLRCSMQGTSTAAHRLPLFTSLRGYDRSWLQSDLIAGLTVWAVLVPEALAYASIAGVSPVVGLERAETANEVQVFTTIAEAIAAVKRTGGGLQLQ